MRYNIINKLASAIRNNIVGGLRGYHTGESMSLDQLEQAVVNERLQIIKEYQLKGILPTNDLLLSINCIPLDCSDIAKCSKCENLHLGRPTLHFEIPQILLDYGTQAIQYIGSVDKQNPFVVYTSTSFSHYQRYRRRGKNRPYVWIDTTPNENGHFDAYVFNAPLLKYISVVAIFKDPRQLCDFDCNLEENGKDDNFSWINNEIEKRLTQKYLQYYRQLAPVNLPNTQEYTPG